MMRRFDVYLPSDPINSHSTVLLSQTGLGQTNPESSRMAPVVLIHRSIESFNISTQDLTSASRSPISEPGIDPTPEFSISASPSMEVVWMAHYSVRREIQ